MRAPLKRGEPAGLVALDAEDRMHQQADVHRAFGELAEHRIDQERHVVVENFQDGDAGAGGARAETRFSPQPACALQQERPGLLADAGELFRALTHEIIGRCALEQVDQKVAGDVAAPGHQERRGCLHKRLTGFAFLGTGQVLRGHVFPLGLLLGAARAINFRRYYPRDPVIRYRAEL